MIWKFYTNLRSKWNIRLIILFIQQFGKGTNKQELNFVNFVAQTKILTETGLANISFSIHF